jgi:hypothetical protein
LRKTLGAFALAIAFVTPAGAEPTTGKTSMQYYVGTWSCQAGPIGRPASKSTATYTLDSGVLREWVDVPAQGKMTKPYVISIATTYDAKKGQYVQTGLDNQAGWWVSSAKPWTGNIEQWADRSNSDNELGRGQVVRTDQNTFSFASYGTLTATKPNFEGTCNRSS